MAIEEKKKVVVGLDAFIEDLWNMADDEYDHDAIEVIEQMVREGALSTLDGLSGVLNDFDQMQIVRKGEFKKKFPMYSKVMTWEEFVANECTFSNGDVAVMEMV